VAQGTTRGKKKKKQTRRLTLFSGCQNDTLCPRFAENSACNGTAIDCRRGGNTQSVTQLQLNGYGFIGSIPTDIGGLTSLQYL
jgi:hypothetical protein